MDKRDDLLDILCEAEAIKRGYDCYDDYYINGPPEEVYEMVTALKRKVTHG